MVTQLLNKLSILYIVYSFIGLNGKQASIIGLTWRFYPVINIEQISNNII